MSLKEFPLENFIGSPNNILDILYQEPDQSLGVRSLEDFLNLPLNENYIKNQTTKIKENKEDKIILKTNESSNR